MARSNPRVMAGKAIFTEVSSCAVAVPSPIIATCHAFAWSRPAGASGEAGSVFVARWTVTPVRS